MAAVAHDSDGSPIHALEPAVGSTVRPAAQHLRPEVSTKADRMRFIERQTNALELAGKLPHGPGSVTASAADPRIEGDISKLQASVSQWEHLETVSWRRDNERDQALHSEKKSLGKRVDLLLFQASSWLIPGLVGVAAATSGALIEHGVQFFSEKRFGSCTGNLFASRQSCCGGLFDEAQNMCASSHSRHGPLPDSRWRSWMQILAGTQATSFQSDMVFYCCLGLVYAVTSAWLVKSFAPTARGSGIPEIKTILGGFVVPDVLSGRTLIVKCCGLCIVVAAGLALGKEGPLVHVACCWAMVLSRLHHRFVENEAKRRELLSAASAAGVSVAFGAPIGGCLFSLEEVSTYFPSKTLWRAFFSAVVAAMALRWWNPTGTDKLTQYQVDYTTVIDPAEYGAFLVLGLLGGVVGALFVFVNVKWSSFRMSTWYKANISIYLEVGAIALLTVTSNFMFDFLRPLANEVIHQLFQSCEVVNLHSSLYQTVCIGSSPEQATLAAAQVGGNPGDVPGPLAKGAPLDDLVVPLLVAAAFRLLQVMLTFGTGVPAGLFVPSLFVGACLGRIFGIYLVYFNDEMIRFAPSGIEPGVYAMVGAVAALGGVCRVGISIVVISAELTGGTQYIVPCMVAVLASRVGDLFTKGIYDCHMELRGYPFLHEPDDVSYTTRICDIMEEELAVITLRGNTVMSLLQICDVHGKRMQGFPLVNNTEERLLMGFIYIGEVRRALEDALRDGANSESQVTFREWCQNRAKLREFGARENPIITPLASQRNKQHASHNGGLLDGMRMHSYVSFDDEHVDLSNLVDDQIMRMVPETPLSTVHTMFRQLGLRMVLVERHGRLQGLLTKKKFVKLLHGGELSIHEKKQFEEVAARKEKLRKRLSRRNSRPANALSQPLLPTGAIA